MFRPPPRSPLFPYTTLFRSGEAHPARALSVQHVRIDFRAKMLQHGLNRRRRNLAKARSEEHTSELQSRGHLVCRLLLEKKKKEHRRRVDEDWELVIKPVTTQ